MQRDSSFEVSTGWGQVNTFILKALVDFDWSLVLGRFISFVAAK
jgi:hypothetical protein